MALDLSLRSRRWIKAAGCLLLLLAAGCTAPLATARLPAAAPPLPPGQARIWLYRDWLPSESLNLANVEVNGSSCVSLDA